MSNEYAVAEDDLAGGGGFTAKPRGNYEGVIENPEVKKDKNGKVYLKFRLGIKHGPQKSGKAFENYLPLSNQGNKFNVARRNSFLRAIALEAGQVPPGAPGGADVSALDGALVGFSLEHEYENVPGEEYSISTSKSKKSRWVEEKWESKLDASGNLIVEGEKIEPRERVLFYSLSDDFEGLLDSDESEEEAWG